MYYLKLLTPEIFETTKASWIRQIQEAGEKIFANHYYRILDWGNKFVNGDCDENTYAYALIDEDKPGVARAILDITHARKNSYSPWLKVLAINVEPSLDVSCEPDLRMLSRIASKSITEALGLTFEDHLSSQLKVYCTEPFSLDFVEGVCASIDGFVDGVIFSTHSNWLVIDKQ
jgi:hypothetical protein